MPYITEERRMIQEQAREFTLNEVLPVANKLDPEKGDIPMDLRDKMAELGYFGILIPEEYGGLGLGCFEYCLVTEELSRGWMSVASLIARGNLLIGAQMMSEEQRARYLPRMAKGEFLGAFAMSEPNAGSDISNISCRARKDGDRLPDQRQQVLVHLRRRRRLHDHHRPHRPSADRQAPPCGLVHVHRREEARHAAQGLQRRADPQDRLFRLEDLGARLRQLPRRRRRHDRRGRPRPSTTPPRAWRRRAPTPRRARSAWPRARSRIRSPTPSERLQFGRPIADFQAIRFKIAEMATEIEAARQLIYFVCEQIDTGQRCDKEASMVKLFAREMAERVRSEGCRSTAAPATPRCMPSSATGATRG